MSAIQINRSSKATQKIRLEKNTRVLNNFGWLGNANVQQTYLHTDKETTIKWYD